MLELNGWPRSPIDKLGAPGLAFETRDGFTGVIGITDLIDPSEYPHVHALGTCPLQQCGDQHFITFSCFHRFPHLAAAADKELFESAVDEMRRRYGFVVFGYVVMPEHVHLLVNEPRLGVLSRVIQALKLSVAARRRERPFWQARYDDFNVFTTAKQVEKLRTMHRNPISRGLVEQPEDWPWSSYRHYATGIEGTVQIESFWTGWRREHRVIPSQVSESRPGAPT